MRVLDMHCDTFWEILEAHKRGEESCVRRNFLQIDLEKMRKGDYLLQNFAMFVAVDRCDDALDTVLRMIDLYHRELDKNADVIGKVECFEDIEKNRAQGKMSSMLTVEEGAVCRGELYVLRDLYRLGVRMLTLTWNFENELGWPNTVARLPGYDPKRRYGLKETGFEFVEEMERLGMIIDVSHLSDDGFYDVCSAAERPFVASHSNARALCPHSRNLTDDMLKKLSDHGGVTGINFYSSFLRDGSDFGEISDIVVHMKHIKNVAGIQCIGLGTDYDGFDSGLELGDCSHMPLLAREMSRNGFSDDEIDAVFSGNVLRVYKEVLS
ncbi:MAG: dipeptidase [Oscillospiraceae bacterium]|nr:dipeptidase [Oscillospiraceae bacterium]